MTEPPENIVIEALHAARQSPCAKSHRGAGVFNVQDGAALLWGTGHNGPPPGFACDGSVECRAACRHLCEHAEARAVASALEYSHVGPFDLVHVKADAAGQLVAGGGPSCALCSRMSLDSRIIAGVWLYQTPESTSDLFIGSIARGEIRYEARSMYIDTPTGRRAERVAQWVRYTVDQFHELSLRASKLPVIRSTR